MGRVHVLGSLNVDHPLRVQRHPAVGETVRGEILPVTPGGKGLNQAVAAALAGTPQHVIVELHGSVGDDESGRWLLDIARSHGVETDHVSVRPARRTGSAWIVVDANGANSVMVDTGANADADWSPDEADLSSDDVVVAQLEVPVEAVARCLDAAREAGARSVFNPSPIGSGRELTTEASIVVVNEPEVAELSAASITATDDPATIGRAAASLRRADQIVIVTLGAAGALAVGPDGIDSVPGIGVEAVDTTGAGDCFLGALAASLAGGMDLSASLRRANRAAAWSVQRHGAVTAMPVAAEIDGKGNPRP